MPPTDEDSPPSGSASRLDAVGSDHGLVEHGASGPVPVVGRCLVVRGHDELPRRMRGSAMA